jgi:glyoxylase-like metal-dependent hydrolase (beta-lactamase superfamily II)
LDAAALGEIEKLGVPSAIAISHPHYYTCMVEWSRVFGDVPIYLHAADAEWVMRPDKNIRFWDGEAQERPGGLRLLRCGGHFEGATVLHWPEGASGKGALLTGDTIQVVPDRKWVSFMYSYPNLVPLNESAVRRIFEAVMRLPFDLIYGAFPGLTVQDGGKQAVIRSAGRYINAIR